MSKLISMSFTNTCGCRCQGVPLSLKIQYCIRYQSFRTPSRYPLDYRTRVWIILGQAMAIFVKKLGILLIYKAIW